MCLVDCSRLSLLGSWFSYSIHIVLHSHPMVFRWCCVLFGWFELSGLASGFSYDVPMALHGVLICLQYVWLIAIDSFVYRLVVSVWFSYGLAWCPGVLQWIRVDLNRLPVPDLRFLLRFMWSCMIPL